MVFPFVVSVFTFLTVVTMPVTCFTSNSIWFCNLDPYISTNT
jgi:hypothetical protein